MVSEEGSVRRDPDRTRPLRDLGAWAVLLTARPLLRFWYNSRSEPPAARWSIEDVRRAARERPVDFTDAALANATRTSAWMALSVLFLIPIVIYGTFFHAGPYLAGAAFTWRVTMYVCLPASAFAAGSVMASGFRWSVAWWFSSRQYQADVTPGAPPPRQVSVFTRWLCMPSNADLIPAGLWCGFVSLGVFAQ